MSLLSVMKLLESIPNSTKKFLAFSKHQKARAQSENTGIGLEIVKKIVKLQAETISLEPQTGKKPYFALLGKNEVIGGGLDQIFFYSIDIALDIA